MDPKTSLWDLLESTLTILTNTRHMPKGVIHQGWVMRAQSSNSNYKPWNNNCVTCGKRYGLAQCTRDLVKSDCRDCLEFLLRAYGSIGTGATVVEKRSWGIFAEGCFMLYDDIPFTPIDEGQYIVINIYMSLICSSGCCLVVRNPTVWPWRPGLESQPATQYFFFFLCVCLCCRRWRGETFPCSKQSFGCRTISDGRHNHFRDSNCVSLSS
ncbi:hypothetical protein ABFX02_11G077800 [Erythranthe guttata]